MGVVLAILIIAVGLQPERLMAYATSPSGTQLHGLGTAKSLYSSGSLRALFAFQAPFTGAGRTNDRDLKLVRAILNTSTESFAYRLNSRAVPKSGEYMTEELYVNFWLVPANRLTALGRPAPPVQSYFISSTPEDVCIRMSVWKRDPVIWTSDPTAGAAIRKACPEQKFKVRVL